MNSIEIVGELISNTTMKVWPLETKERFYSDMYAAYLSHEVSGDKSQLEYYARYLKELERFWNLSSTRLRALEKQVRVEKIRAKKIPPRIDNKTHRHHRRQ